MTSTRERAYIDLAADDPHSPPGAKLKLEQALDDYRFYSEGQKEMEQGKKTAAAQVIELVQLSGYDGVDSGDTRFSLTSSTTRRISKERLLERGVSADIIDYATEVSTSEQFLRPTKRPKSSI